VVRSHDVQMTCRARLAPVEVSELSEEIGLGWRGVVSAGSAVQCSAVQSRRLNIRRQKSSSGWWQACSFLGVMAVMDDMLVTGRPAAGKKRGVG